MQIMRLKLSDDVSVFILSDPEMGAFAKGQCHLLPKKKKFGAGLVCLKSKTFYAQFFILYDHKWRYLLQSLSSFLHAFSAA